MAHQISKPAPAGSGFKAAEHVGELVVFIGCSLEVDVKTTFGDTNAARVQLIVPLDGDSAGEVYVDSLLFGKVLTPSLTNADSGIVVGRLAVGQAKAGQSAPYILQDPTEDEEAAVLKWLEEHVEEDAAGRFKVKPF